MAQDTNSIVGRSCRRGLGEWSLPSDTWESVSGVPYLWHCERYGHHGVSPTEATKLVCGAGAPAVWGESRNAGIVQPGKQKGQGRSYCCQHLPNVRCTTVGAADQHGNQKIEERKQATPKQINKQKKQTNHKLKNIGIGSQRSFGICILAGAFSNLIYLCVVWGWLDEMTSRSSFQCNFVLLHSLSLIIWMWYKYYTTCTSWFKICLTHYYFENQPLCSLE